jgi:hypothetical protein
VQQGIIMEEEDPASLQAGQQSPSGSGSTISEDEEDGQEAFYSPVKEAPTAPTQQKFPSPIKEPRVRVVPIVTTTTTGATTSEEEATVEEVIEVATEEVLDVSTPSPSGTHKRSSQASSKSKQKKKARKEAQCRKGARVKVTRNTLYHVLKDEAQKLSTKLVWEPSQFLRYHHFWIRQAGLQYPL